MLLITVPSTELWDDENQEFRYVKETNLQLEHSLISISKWESKWHKAFFGRQEKTSTEVLDYIRCMTLNKNINPNVYMCLTKDNFDAISDYINDKMTAYFPKDENTPISDTLMSELFYYYMTVFNIPFECEKWHINRLIALIKICGIKSSGPKKMSQAEIARQHRAINKARRRSR